MCSVVTNHSFIAFSRFQLLKGTAPLRNSCIMADQDPTGGCSHKVDLQPSSEEDVVSPGGKASAPSEQVVTDDVAEHGPTPAESAASGPKKRGSGLVLPRTRSQSSRPRAPAPQQEKNAEGGDKDENVEQPKQSEQPSPCKDEGAEAPAGDSEEKPPEATDEAADGGKQEEKDSPPERADAASSVTTAAPSGSEVASSEPKAAPSGPKASTGGPPKSGPREAQSAGPESTPRLPHQDERGF